jgi:hypothetical protein
MRDVTQAITEHLSRYFINIKSLEDMFGDVTTIITSFNLLFFTSASSGRV